MTTQTKTPIQFARQFAQQMKKWRQDFHAHPELSFHEFRTAGKVEQMLRALPGMHVETILDGRGVVATLSSYTEGEEQESKRTIAIRADMDALPIQEQSEQPYASRHEGVMHACGHDAHTAMLLGSAHVLASMHATGQFTGRIKFIFQPAEEGPDENGLTGAVHMLQAGVLDDVDQIIALHVCPWRNVGEIQVHDGYSMGSVDVFRAKIKGSGGHAAYPQTGLDPIWLLAQILPTLYSMPGRRISPLDSAVISVGQVHAGKTSNVIPTEVELEGTCRSYAPEVRQILLDELHKVFSQIEALGGECELMIMPGEPALYNDPGVNEYIKKSAKQLYPEMRIYDEAFGLGGEDFGFMAQQIPGTMFFLGCASDEGKRRDLHTPDFDINEECMPIGVSIVVQSVLSMLQDQD